MEFWKKKEKLNIIYENEQLDQKRILYRLYEKNFTATLNYIFQDVLKRKRYRCGGQRLEDSPEEMINVFPFIGSRGSGKTTALKEFCRILDSLSDNETKNWWLSRFPESFEEMGSVEQVRNESFRFHVLPLMDASLLGDGEELLELILTELYKRFKHSLEPENYYRAGADGIREITGTFEELLQMYRSLSANKEWENYTVSSMVQLKGSSGDVATRIKELLNQLIDLREGKADHEYFVIPIDDLDLNLSHGYEMLEQLQKYFSYYKVIILVTVDYDQMWRVCVEHFHKGMKSTDEEDLRIGEELHSRKLANDYMTKVFPLQQRMYIPDMRKNANRIRIAVKDMEPVTIKKYVMCKVASYMKIFYDAEGGKRHFCEPDTVRELVEYNSFLDSLNPIEFDKLTDIETLPEGERERAVRENRLLLHSYDQNHERFNWDITKRLAQTTLSSSQHRAFQKLLDFDLERRAMYFVKAKRDEKGVIRINDVRIEARKEYCYGDLLEQIYTWGRNFYEDKPFISSILASFTSQMVREYMMLRYNGERKDTEKYRKRLVQFLGNSFSNEWSGRIFPAVSAIDAEKSWKSVRCGFIRKAPVEMVFLHYDISAWHQISERETITGDMLEGMLEWWLGTQKLMETLECLDMFFVSKSSERSYGGVSYKFKVLRRGEQGSDQKEVKNDTLEVTVQGSSSMDVMGFVLKSLDYEAHRKRILDNVYEQLCSSLEQYYASEKCSMSWETTGVVERLLRKCSIFEKKDAECREIAFPYYDLDLAYNVIKRILINAEERIKEQDVFAALLHLYDRIEESLASEAQHYDGQMKYDGVFRTCPYIVAMRELGRDPAAQKQISGTLVLCGKMLGGSPDNPSD